MVAISVSVFLLLVILLCIFKQQKAKKRREAERRDDRNPTYGKYYHPNPRVEVKDTNPYYSSGLTIICRSPNSTDFLVLVLYSLYAVLAGQKL